MSFWIDLIRLRDSSESKIIPSTLSYSSYTRPNHNQQSERQRQKDKSGGCQRWTFPFDRARDPQGDWARKKRTDELDVGSHFGNLLDLDHDEVVDLGVLVLVESHLRFPI
jgi:hypothetical protein